MLLENRNGTITTKLIRFRKKISVKFETPVVRFTKNPIKVKNSAAKTAKKNPFFIQSSESGFDPRWSKFRQLQ